MVVNNSRHRTNHTHPPSECVVKEREPDEVINERLRRRYKQLDSSDQATRQKKNVGYILDVVNRKREPPGIGVTATKPTNAGDPYPATPSSDADGGSPQQ
eukprot:TRINITY_DN53464_c0_g1_i1.p2 TRINITY_DN53464_c0_g1~~TRINITY_DN53464_c0_g1_i1.p2  ORF type:complete len:100 (+),score=29.00 TRINITY_DN53464_c0_g1_i1:190-489(+)